MSNQLVIYQILENREYHNPNADWRYMVTNRPDFIRDYPAASHCNRFTHVFTLNNGTLMRASIEEIDGDKMVWECNRYVAELKSNPNIGVTKIQCLDDECQQYYHKANHPDVEYHSPVGLTPTASSSQGETSMHKYQLLKIEQKGESHSLATFELHDDFKQFKVCSTDAIYVHFSLPGGGNDHWWGEVIHKDDQTITFKLHYRFAHHMLNGGKLNRISRNNGSYWDANKTAGSTGVNFSYTFDPPVTVNRQGINEAASPGALNTRDVLVIKKTRERDNGWVIDTNIPSLYQGIKGTTQTGFSHIMHFSNGLAQNVRIEKVSVANGTMSWFTGYTNGDTDRKLRERPEISKVSRGQNYGNIYTKPFVEYVRPDVTATTATSAAVTPTGAYEPYDNDTIEVLAAWEDGPHIYVEVNRHPKLEVMRRNGRGDHTRWEFVDAQSLTSQYWEHTDQTMIIRFIEMGESKRESARNALRNGKAIREVGAYAHYERAGKRKPSTLPAATHTNVLYNVTATASPVASASGDQIVILDRWYDDRHTYIEINKVPELNDVTEATTPNGRAIKVHFQSDWWNAKVHKVHADTIELRFEFIISASERKVFRENEEIKKFEGAVTFDNQGKRRPSALPQHHHGETGVPTAAAKPATPAKPTQIDILTWWEDGTHTYIEVNKTDLIKDISASKTSQNNRRIRFESDYWDAHVYEHTEQTTIWRFRELTSHNVFNRNEKITSIRSDGTDIYKREGSEAGPTVAPTHKHQPKQISVLAWWGDSANTYFEVNRTKELKSFGTGKNLTFRWQTDYWGCEIIQVHDDTLVFKIGGLRVGAASVLRDNETIKYVSDGSSNRIYDTEADAGVSPTRSKPTPKIAGTPTDQLEILLWYHNGEHLIVETNRPQMFQHLPNEEKSNATHNFHFEGGEVFSACVKAVTNSTIVWKFPNFTSSTRFLELDRKINRVERRGSDYESAYGNRYGTQPKYMRNSATTVRSQPTATLTKPEFDRIEVLAWWEDERDAVVETNRPKELINLQPRPEGEGDKRSTHKITFDHNTEWDAFVEKVTDKTIIWRIPNIVPGNTRALDDDKPITRLRYVESKLKAAYGETVAEAMKHVTYTSALSTEVDLPKATQGRAAGAFDFDVPELSDKHKMLMLFLGR